MEDEPKDIYQRVEITGDEAKRIQQEAQRLSQELGLGKATEEQSAPSAVSNTNNEKIPPQTPIVPRDETPQEQERIITPADLQPPKDKGFLRRLFGKK